MKLELKVGKVYKDKSGENIPIIRIDTFADKIYFVGLTKFGTKHYYLDGICSSDMDWTGMYNLIEECYITNPFLDKNIRLEKMLSNYKKYGTLVIGLDFDFTIKCPINHYIYNDIVEFLQTIQNKDKYNFLFCIWTANPDREMVEKTYLDNGLRWDYYNYSPINPSSIKPHFNILLDDCAGLNEAFQLLKDIKLELDK